jgi:hypothetical protein
MTNLWHVLTICALTAPLVAVAQDGAAPGAERSEHEQHAAPSDQASPGDQPMTAMHRHMLEMQAQMARIEATEDAGERQGLIEQHLQSMRQHMQMMGSMSAERRAATDSRCAQGDAACTMEEMRAAHGMTRERMRTLEDRLASVEQLVQQMLDHQRAGDAQDAEDRGPAAVQAE